MVDPKRKIPYNYTSADDDQIISHLFGSDLRHVIQALESEKDTGRSSRRLYRFMGDLFIIQRNPFLFQEMVDHSRLKNRLFSEFETDLAAISVHASNPHVRQVLDQCQAALSTLSQKIHSARSFQHHLLKQLSPLVGRENVYVDPFNLTAHATDATDWRRFLPVAVLRPDREDQVPRLIRKIDALKMHIIPRGGGTGLTGGATPLHPDCIMINTEKLNRISPIEFETDPDNQRYAAVTVEAGVITQDVIDDADSQGYIFATDPTSAWACTIGGNLAENAGGKKAVLYGTAIDNLLSYKIAMPDGLLYTIARRNHPRRKTLPQDTVVFDVFHQDGQMINTIEISGTQMRKKGLGKDVTNKTLNGLFGIQKEGCDGIITSARFILYPKFDHKKTICIEFFGNDMSQAAQVIKEICAAFSGGMPALMALEHFDEEYIKAIRYKTKTSVGTRLIAVLLIDMVADDAAVLQAGVDTLENLLDRYDKTGFIVAKTDTEADRFWQDRKRLGAIAAHTNAFKLNEDIVLPIDSLADFARFIDACNIEEKKINQIQIIHNMIDYLETAVPLADPDLLQKRVRRAKDLAYQVRKKIEIASRDAIEAGIHAGNFYTHVLDSLRGYTLVSEKLTQVYEKTRARLIVIATHMHAGDGNVHVNIPVLSNDRQMMERASLTADRIMEEAIRLNGAVSGEHGIGITKFKHLDPERIQEFEAYRRQVDPRGLMNPNKLSEPDIIEKVFTPSFNLLELEARILKHGDLSRLAKEISSCVRCGKCKAQCPVFYPAENMFYHPRNKNLSIAALIEALLYISQRTQSTGFHILKNIRQIADHCTMCHKCLENCPVSIDSALISIQERNVLQNMGFKHTAIPTKLTLWYLSSKNRMVNTMMRTVLLEAGTRLQKTGYLLAAPVVKQMTSRGQFRGIWPLLSSPVTSPDSPPLYRFLPKTRHNQAMIIEPETGTGEVVFYFPGCGSERVFPRISMASIFLLLSAGNTVILPPPFMCCAYPFLVNARQGTHDKMVLENSIILNQIRDMFQDLTFDACIVSCGTCMESLNRMHTEEIFDAPLIDISQYVLARNPDLQLDRNCLYHRPCHDSLHNTALSVLQQHSLNACVRKVESCCSEAGTMALSRPDITHSMLKRKTAAIKTAADQQPITVLTNCPSCLQGLGRQKPLKVKPVHLAVELARLTGKDNWEKKLKSLLLAGSRGITF